MLEKTFVSDVPMARSRASTDVDRLLKDRPHLESMPSDLLLCGGLSSSSSFGIGRFIRALTDVAGLHKGVAHLRRSRVVI